GEAIVKNLAPDYAVVAQGRDSRKLAKLSGLGQQVYPVRYDLSDTAAFAETFGRLPKVDALINAAAIAPRYAFDDATAAVWSEVLHLNITVPAELTRCVLTQLKESTGTVVYLGTGASRNSSRINAVYAACKNAMQALADGWCMRTTTDGICVSTVAPGYVNTPMSDWDDNYPIVWSNTLIQPATVARSSRHVI